MNAFEIVLLIFSIIGLVAALYLGYVTIKDVCSKKYIGRTAMNEDELKREVVWYVRMASTNHEESFAEAILKLCSEHYKKQERERIEQWGEEECANYRHHGSILIKRQCSQCWEALQGE